MAAPSFAAAGAGVASTSASLAVAYPSGIGSGDCLILHGYTSTGTGATTPAGWTAIVSDDAQGYNCSFYKIASGSESGTVTLTFTGGFRFNNSGQYGRMYRFISVQASPPNESGDRESGTSTTITDRSVTSTAASRLAVNLVALASNQSIGVFTGMTGGTWAEAVAEYGSATGNDCTLQLQVASLPSVATINGGTVTVGASTYYNTLGFALIPGTTAPLTKTGSSNSPRVASGASVPVISPKPDLQCNLAINFGDGLEDVDSRVRQIQITRGRPFNMDIVEAGTLSTLLKNDDGALDPSSITSPWFGKVLPLLPTQVARRKNNVTKLLFTGAIERWQPQWVPPNYQEMQMEASDAFETLSNITLYSGQSTLTTNLTGSNNDLTFTSAVSGGDGDDITIEYVIPGPNATLDATTNTPENVNYAMTISSVRLGRVATISPVGANDQPVPVLVTVSGNDITVSLSSDGSSNSTSTAAQIKAFIEGDAYLSSIITISYPAGNNGTGTVTAMAKTNLFGGKWEQELSGARINRVLDFAGWPVSSRAIDAGVSQVVAKGFAAKDGISALQHIQDVADSELGYVFMSAANVITYHDNAHRSTATRSVTPQATFSDDGTGFSYTAIDPSFDKDRITNQVAVTSGNENAVAQVADDTYSQTGTGSPPAGATNVPPGGFKVRTLSRSTQLAIDADALAQAVAIVAAYSYPRYRFDAIRSLEPADTGQWFTTVAGLEIGDLVTLRTTPPATTTTTSYNAFVEQITDEVSPGLPWARTLKLSPSSQTTGGGGGGGGGGTAGALKDSSGDDLLLDDATAGILG